MTVTPDEARRLANDARAPRACPDCGEDASLVGWPPGPGEGAGEFECSACGRLFQPDMSAFALAVTVIAQAEQLKAKDAEIERLKATAAALESSNEILMDCDNERVEERATLLTIIGRLRKGDEIVYSQGRYCWAPRGYMPYEPIAPDEQAALFADRNNG